jgi:hemerythrin-like domain-containing protein
MKIKQFMSQDHRNCDQFFANAEAAAANGDWDAANEILDEFINAMERHLGIEEQTLFPAFEQETGMLSGPTEMMRMEHDQMRSLFTEMRDAMDQQDSDEYLGVAETLLILMQQHNMKEEQILYTMMDQRLSEDVDGWQTKFEAWTAPATKT